MTALSAHRISYLADDIEQVVPTMLQHLPRWVNWRAGEPNERGKFPKVPIDPQTGRAIVAQDRANWRSFTDAVAAVRAGRASGIGIVLDSEVPVITETGNFTLTAIDLDQYDVHREQHFEITRDFRHTYGEISPSGDGVRIIGLSREPVKGCNAHQGRELYSTKRFMTVTGFSGRGSLGDITQQVTKLQEEWFGGRVNPAVPNRASCPAIPETRENVSVVLSMLEAVSSDCAYELWRNLIWSIASTGWACASDIAHRWSKKAPHRYEADAVERLLVDFDPGRSISIGTLVHQAKLFNWNGNLPWNGNAILPEQGELPVQSARFQLLTASQLQSLPAPEFRVRGLLPATGMAAIYGAPGSGKTFISLSCGHAIATGREWFGHPVKQAPVVYLVLEGQSGIAKRVKALELHTGVPCTDNLRFCHTSFSLLDRNDPTELAKIVREQLQPGAVLFIDTLNQASPGADENSSQDMSRIIGSVKHIAEEIGGLVVLVHHAGKDSARGLRGHSSLLAALDTVIEVKVEPQGKSWYVRKAKDDISHNSFDFELRRYQVGQDAYGPITSCAVERVIRAAGQATKKPTGKHQIRAFEVLTRNLSNGDSGLSFDQAVTLVAPELEVTDRHRERATEALSGLVKNGHLLRSEWGLLSLPPEALPNPNPIGGFGFSGNGPTPNFPVSGISGPLILEPA